MKHLFAMSYILKCGVVIMLYIKGDNARSAERAGSREDVDFDITNVVS